jgi:hypothetical protein
MTMVLSPAKPGKKKTAGDSTKTEASDSISADSESTEK